MTTTRRIVRLLYRKVPGCTLTILAILLINFFLLRLAPGDAVDVFAAESGTASAEFMQQLRARFGLDAPLLTQLQNYLGTVAQASLGFSPRYNMPVADLIGERLPSTLALMGASLLMAILAGVALGLLMALNAGRWPDRILSILTLLLYSLPGFWIGLMAIVLFSIKLGWLPSGGKETIAAGYTGLAFVLDRVRHIILPGLTLSLFYIAIYGRVTRAAVLEVSQQDYVRTARAKGLSERTIAWRHILRNALVPVTTLAGVHIGGLIGGAVVVETVFSWPGMGRLAFEAILRRDFNVLLGVLLLSSILVVAINLLVDVLQTWLDPRIEAA